MDSQDYFANQKDGDWQQLARAILQLGGLEPNEPLRILDVGCGRGHLSLAFHELGHQTVALEPSPSFHAEACKNSGPDYILGSLADVADHQEFDLVVFMAVFEHLTDPIGDLSRATELVRPGGRICVLNVPNAAFLRTRLVNLALRMAMTPYVVNGSPLHPPFHLWEFRESTFVKLAQRLSLHIRYLRTTTSRNFSRPAVFHLMEPLIAKLRIGEIIRVVLEKPEMC